MNNAGDKSAWKVREKAHECERRRVHTQAFHMHFSVTHAGLVLLALYVFKSMPKCILMLQVYFPVIKLIVCLGYEFCQTRVT